MPPKAGGKRGASLFPSGRRGEGLDRGESEILTNFARRKNKREKTRGLDAAAAGYKTATLA